MDHEAPAAYGAMKARCPPETWMKSRRKSRRADATGPGDSWPCVTTPGSMLSSARMEKIVFHFRLQD